MPPETNAATVERAPHEVPQTVDRELEAGLDDV